MDAKTQIASDSGLYPGGLATINEMVAETQIPASWWYARSRTNALPGLIRLGRHLRIDVAAFFAAAERGEVA